MSAWRTRCGVFAIACACLLFTPRVVAASHHTVVGDFDGDGRHDRATLKRHAHSSEIRIWLSTTNATTVIQSPDRIGAIAARDLDGDHRDELIGRESLNLQIWSVREQSFHRLHPQKDDRAGWNGSPAPNRVEDPPEEEPAADATAGASSVAVLLAPRPRAPDLIPASLASSLSAGFRSAQLLAPVAPRPPPIA
jgi:hypothetical protein